MIYKQWVVIKRTEEALQYKFVSQEHRRGGICQSSRAKFSSVLAKYDKRTPSSKSRKVEISHE